MVLKDKVIEKIERALSAIGNIQVPFPVKIEYSRDEKFGDYACTIAMDKNFRNAYKEIDPSFSNPKNFASAIIEKLKLENENSQFFQSMEIAGAGYINLSISGRELFHYAKEAVSNLEKYGSDENPHPENIIFEFVSANPTGPLNVVSARAAALGDCCCNLLEAIGNRVTREYYVNNFGNQVDLLGVSCLLRYLEGKGVALKFSKKDDAGNYSYEQKAGLPFPPEGYHGDYLSEISENLANENSELIPGQEIIASTIQLSQNSSVDEDYLNILQLSPFAEKFGVAATEYFLKRHKTDLEGFRVHFDNFFSERSLHEENRVLSVRDKIQKYIFKKDEKEFFRSTEFGDDKDRVIVRDDGRPTYLLADIAYHSTKIERGFQKIYNIWGPDHHGYISRLAGAITAMGYPEGNFRVLIAQQVNLLENGKPILMSKRAGKFITMKTLTEEIPVDVLRYFFVMRSLESHLDFDFAEAKDTSEKNPFYYVAYAHARIRSIFQKASEKNILPLKETSFGYESVMNMELTPERRRLLWFVARFPEEVRDAAIHLEPHRLITFLYQLAGALSKFYGPSENKIIEKNQEEGAALLHILDSVAICLKNGLKLLGIEAPERLIRDVEV